MIVSEMAFGFWSLNTVGCFSACFLDLINGFFRMMVRRMSIMYEMSRYRMMSIARPAGLMGDFSTSLRPKSRNGYG